MTYPKFFDEVPKIQLKDDLADFLGVFSDGIFEITYLDIVKMAGHSCPTVMGAYLMILKGLKSLYENQLPIRGEILVEFPSKQDEGITGVISTVVSNITGATSHTGFKGLNEKFNRNDLMRFEIKDLKCNIRLRRIDSSKVVDVSYDLSSIKIHDDLNFLMQKCLNNSASSEEKREFMMLWQNRVYDIVKNIDKVIIIS